MFWNKKPELGRVCLQSIDSYVLNIRPDNSTRIHERYIADTLHPFTLHFIPVFISDLTQYTRLGITKQGDDVYVLNEDVDFAKETMKQRGCNTCPLRDRDHVLFEYAKRG